MIRFTQCRIWVGAPATGFVTVACVALCCAELQAKARAAPVAGAPTASTSQVRSKQTLADVLNQVRWDPETRGTLLVVAPEETTIPVRRRDANSDLIPPLEPDAEGAHRMSQIEASFDRRVVGLHSLSVLAPALKVPFVR